MLYYIRKYPVSLIIIAIILYLSFYHPSSDSLPKIPHFDKLAHFCMYGGLSGMLWLEFLWKYRTQQLPMRHVWIGALLCPILLSGLIEILQDNLTYYRGGEWADFLANCLGAITASLISFYIIRPYIRKKFSSDKKRRNR